MKATVEPLSPKRRLGIVIAGLMVVATGACKSGSGTIAQTGTAAVSPLDFGQLPVGDSLKETLEMQAYNASVLVLGLQIQGPNASDFAVVSPPTSNQLSTDSLTTAVVAFTPSAPGPRTASLVVQYDPYDLGGPGDGGTLATTTVSLTGQGVAASDITLEVDPLSLDFGPVLIGQYQTLYVNVKNTNAFRISLVLGSADGGFDGGEFSVPTPGPSLDENAFQKIPVTFVPTQSGAAVGSLPMSACQDCPVQSVALSATGVNASLKFTPEAVNFGFVLDGTFAPPAPVSVTVAGNTPVTVTGVAVAENRASVFGVTNISPPLPHTFSDGGANTLTFDVTYTPSHFPGGDYDQVEVSYELGTAGSGASPAPAKLNVTGNLLPDAGCTLVVTPSGTLDFGTVVPGGQVTKSLQMINAGASDCVLTSVQLAPGSDVAYAIGEGDAGGVQMLDAGLVIPAHAELEGLGQPGLPITFTAPHDSPRYHRTAILSFAYSDPAPRTGQVELTGTLASAYAASSPWPRWAHDNANTGQGEIDTSASDGGLLWSLALITAQTEGLADAGCALQQGGYYTNGPIVGADRLLYVVGCDGIFYAVDELGGSIAWTKQLQAPAPGTHTTPALAPDDVIELAYGSVSGPNYTVDIPYDAGIVATATIERLGGTCTQPQPLPPGWPPNLSPSLYYDPLINYYQIAADTHSLISLQNQDLCLAGAQISWSAPALSLGGALYSMVSGPLLYLFPPEAAVGDFTEAVLPVAAGLSSSQVSSPAVGDDGTSYWCSEGSCVAINAAGNELWTRTLGSSSVDYSNDHGAPVLGNGQLYVLVVGRSLSSYSAQLESIDPASGASNWTYLLPGATATAAPTAWGIMATPALTSNDLLIVPNVDGVYAIQAAGPSEGQLAWKVPITGGTFAAPAIGADGTIYVGTVSQGLVAIDPVAKAIRWSFIPKNVDGSAASISGSPAIGEFGVFVTADNGFLYGIH